MPAVRRRDVKIRVAIKRQALWTPQPTIKHGNIAALRDAVHAIVTRSSRPGDVEVAARMKRQMIRGERRLQRGKHKNLAARADFENRAAAIADVKIFRVIKRNPGGDAHALNPLLGATLWSNAMDRAVVAAGNEKIAGAVDRQARWIDQRSDERLDAVVRRDFVKRNRNALSPRPAEGHINISVGIDCRIRLRMKIVRNLNVDRNRMRAAFTSH